MAFAGPDIFMDSLLSDRNIHSSYRAALDHASRKRAADVLDSVCRDIVANGPRVRARTVKHHARRMLRVPAEMEKAWPGLSEMDPADGVDLCRRLIRDRRHVPDTDYARAALIVVRTLRRGERRALANLEAC